MLAYTCPLSLLDRFTASVSAAYQRVRGGVAQSMPDGSIVLDPAAAWRWCVTYTPERLDEIRARRSYSEIVQLFDDMLTDDRLRAVAFMRAQALMGAEIEFVEGQGRRKGRALKAADAESDLWEMLPEAEWLQMHVWGLGINFGTGRKRWWERAPGVSQRFIPRRRNGRIVPLLEFWHPRNFRLDPTAQQWIARVNEPGSIAPLDRHMSFGDGEFVAFCPWGGAAALDRGLWLPASRLWLLKQHVIRSSASLGQRMSTPIKVIEYGLVQQGIPVLAEGGSDSKRKQLVADIFAMQRQGVVSLPPGFTMKLLSVPATSWQMLKEQWDAINSAFAILWLGNNLTVEIKGGSLAAANAGADMLTFLRKFDANAESTFVHNDVLADWAEINFADRSAAPWPCRDVDPPEDLKSAAATTYQVMQAVALGESKGWLFDKEALDERYNLGLVDGQPNTEPPAKPTPGDPALPPANAPPQVQVPNVAA